MESSDDWFGEREGSILRTRVGSDVSHDFSPDLCLPATITSGSTHVCWCTVLLLCTAVHSCGTHKWHGLGEEEPVGCILAAFPPHVVA